MPILQNITNVDNENQLYVDTILSINSNNSAPILFALNPTYVCYHSSQFFGKKRPGQEILCRGCHADIHLSVWSIKN